MYISTNTNYNEAIRIEKNGSTVFKLAEDGGANLTIHISQTLINEVVLKALNADYVNQKIVGNLVIDKPFIESMKQQIVPLLKDAVLDMIKQDYMKSFDTILKD